MEKISDNLQIYGIKNFCNPIYFNLIKKQVVNEVLCNKKYHDNCIGYNYPIIEDDSNFFKNLYSKYYNFCLKKFKFNPTKLNDRTCWAYVSDKEDYKEEWHNHINTSTINSVYYLSIPDRNTSINFRENDNIFEYNPKENELLIFPNHLEHKPNRCYGDGYRISINMEIICIEDSNYLFKNINVQS